MALEWITSGTTPLIDDYEEMDVNVYAKYQAIDIDEHHTIKVSILSSNVPSSINMNVFDETGVQLIGILPIVMGEETYGFTNIRFYRYRLEEPEMIGISDIEQYENDPVAVIVVNPTEELLSKYSENK